MKRFIFLAAIVIIAVAASACTREKPAEPLASPVAQQVTPSVSTVVPVTPTVSVTGVPVIETPVVPITPTMVMTPTTPIPVTSPVALATPAPTVSGAPGTYTVQAGDSLLKIATRFGVTTQDILAANPGLNPNLIYPGQTLNVPGAGSSFPTAIAVTTPVPAGTPVAPAVPSVSANPGTHTVQRGEWLYAIARKYGISVDALLAANPGINPNFVYPGQVLNIPGGGGNPAPNPAPNPVPGTYVVQAGDTLYSIAVRFHTTVYALQLANHMRNINFLYPGQTLIVPQ
jgi:LysM repeat protein